MKLSLLWFLFMLPILSFGQVEWAPEGAIWHYDISSGGNGPHNNSYITIESIGKININEKECKELKLKFYDNHHVEYDISILGFTYFHTDTTSLYIYQENQKIYYYHYLQDTFKLLYDFTLDVGDTLDIEFSYFKNFPDYNSYLDENNSDSIIVDVISYEVDSIKTLNFTSTNRKAIHLKPINRLSNDDFSEKFGGWQIEGIGSFKYFIWQTIWGAWHGAIINGISCYNDGSFTYQNPDVFFSSCTYVPNQNVLSLDVEVYPNPVVDFLYIEQEEVKVTTIEVINIQGQTIFNQSLINHQNKIDLSNIFPGIYFLKLTDIDDNIGVYKILKQ